MRPPLLPTAPASNHFAGTAPGAGGDATGGTTHRQLQEEVDNLRRRLDAAVRHAVRAEASARRCQQDLAAERQQREGELAATAERVQVAEVRSA